MKCSGDTFYFCSVLTGLSQSSMWFQWCKVTPQEKFRFWVQLPESGPKDQKSHEDTIPGEGDGSRSWEWASISAVLKTKGSRLKKRRQRDEPFAPGKCVLCHLTLRGEWHGQIMSYRHKIDCDSNKNQTNGKKQEDRYNSSQDPSTL